MTTSLRNRATGAPSSPKTELQAKSLPHFPTASLSAWEPSWKPGQREKVPVSLSEMHDIWQLHCSMGYWNPWKHSQCFQRTEDPAYGHLSLCCDSTPRTQTISPPPFEHKSTCVWNCLLFFSWAFYICSLFSCTCPQLPKNKLVSFFISFHCSQSLCPLQIPPLLSSSGTTLACGFGEEGFVWSFNAWQNSLIDFLGNWNLFFYLQNRESLTLQASSWCPGSLLQFQFGVTVFLEGKSSANAMLILSHCWGWSMKQLYFLVMF